MPAQADVNDLLCKLHGEVEEAVIRTDGHGYFNGITIEFKDGRIVEIKVGDGTVVENGRKTIIALKPPSA